MHWRHWRPRGRLLIAIPSGCLPSLLATEGPASSTANGRL